MELIGYVTARGRDLSAKLLTGTALHITRVTAGSGSTSPDALTLEQEQQALSVSPARRSGATVTLPVTLAAALAETDYTLREAGVYAEDPDLGEILYRIYRLSPGLDITAGAQLAIRFELQETISDASEVVVDGNAAGLLTHGDLNTMRGAANGLATLDENALVPVNQLPYTWGTEELEAGVSPLPTGALHFVYE